MSNSFMILASAAVGALASAWVSSRYNRPRVSCPACPACPPCPQPAPCPPCPVVHPDAPSSPLPSEGHYRTERTVTSGGSTSSSALDSRVYHIISGFNSPPSGFVIKDDGISNIEIRHPRPANSDSGYLGSVQLDAVISGSSVPITVSWNRSSIFIDAFGNGRNNPPTEVRSMMLSSGL